MRFFSFVAFVATVYPANLALALTTSRIRTPHSRSIKVVSSPPPRILVESTIEETLERTGTNENNLSPFLQGMVDEQRELQMNVGKAMDVLRKDYPYFMKRAPGKLINGSVLIIKLVSHA